MRKFQFQLKWLFFAMLVVLCLAFSWSLYGRYKAKVRQELLEELREMNAIVEAELKKKEGQFKELVEQNKVIQKRFSTREGCCFELNEAAVGKAPTDKGKGE